MTTESGSMTTGDQRSENAAHTPGPWWIADAVGHVLGPDAIKVATTYFPERSFAEHKANARLIAAAPDLLRALQLIKRFGELACVSADAGQFPQPTGGKKPATKDVWQFPRHLLTEIDIALANSSPPSE